MADELQKELLKRTQPSTMQKIADVASIPIGGPMVLDWLTKKLVTPSEHDRHPEGERQGSIENLIKFVGEKFGSLVGPDKPYLEQYLHPNTDVLPGTKPPVSKSGGIPYRTPDYKSRVLYSKDPVHSGTTQWNDIIPSGIDTSPNTDGLGNHSILDPVTGKPTEKNLDGKYQDNAHVFDVWDFDTKAGMIKDRFGGDTKTGTIVGELVKRVLKNSGQPFGVYGPREK